MITEGGRHTVSQDLEAATVLDYLQLSRLLDEVEQGHPEISGALRLTLLRSRRLNRAGWLDTERFREVLIELTFGAMDAEGRTVVDYRRSPV